MEVWYINLDRRPDRDVSIRENLFLYAVPPNRIRRFNAIDRDDFETPEDLVASAVKDGFPQFGEVLEHSYILQYTGYMFSYLRALRAIGSSSCPVLLMEDDYHLCESYGEICRSLVDLDAGWKMAMLGYNISEDSLVSRPRLADSDYWQLGAPSNGNSANIYSPLGAGFVLEKCLSDMQTTPECVIQKMVNEPGIYSRILSKISIVTSPYSGTTDVMDGRWR